MFFLTSISAFRHLCGQRLLLLSISIRLLTACLLKFVNITLLRPQISADLQIINTIGMNRFNTSFLVQYEFNLHFTWRLAPLRVLEYAFLALLAAFLAVSTSTFLFSTS